LWVRHPLPVCAAPRAADCADSFWLNTPLGVRRSCNRLQLFFCVLVSIEDFAFPLKNQTLCDQNCIIHHARAHVHVLTTILKESSPSGIPLRCRAAFHRFRLVYLLRRPGWEQAAHSEQCSPWPQSRLSRPRTCTSRTSRATTHPRLGALQMKRARGKVRAGTRQSFMGWNLQRYWSRKPLAMPFI